MLLCLELLSVHLTLASAAGAPASVLGQHAQPLRQLLFKLLDATVSDDLQEVRHWCCNIVSTDWHGKICSCISLQELSWKVRKDLLYWDHK